MGQFDEVAIRAEVDKWLARMKKKHEHTDDNHHKDREFNTTSELRELRGHVPMIIVKEYTDRKKWENYVNTNMAKAQRVFPDVGVVHIVANTYSGALIAEWKIDSGRISEGRSRFSLLKRLATW